MNERIITRITPNYSTQCNYICITVWGFIMGKIVVSSEKPHFIYKYGLTRKPC